MSLFIRRVLLDYYKEYYRINQEFYREYSKRRYENYKDIIKERFKKRYTCPCGAELGFYWRMRHYDSKKHNKRIMLKLYLRRWYGLLF